MMSTLLLIFSIYASCIVPYRGKTGAAETRRFPCTFQKDSLPPTFPRKYGQIPFPGLLRNAEIHENLGRRFLFTAASAAFSQKSQRGGPSRLPRAAAENAASPRRRPEKL